MISTITPHRTTSIAWATIMVLASLCIAQDPYEDTPGVPETPGANRVPALVDAYNSGDANAIEAVIAEHFTGRFAEIPMAEHVAAWRSSLRETGPLQLLAFRTYQPPNPDLVPIFRCTVTGAYHAAVLPVEAAPPHRFTGIRFAPARTPSYLEPGAPPTPRELVQTIDALVDRLTEYDMFSGSVVIAKDGQTLYERATGLASRRFDVANQLDTKFNLGSMNKMFTAVAIGQLVDQGRLAFEDLVGLHLPDYPNQQVREQVQIRHLLSHTSGMGNHFKREFMEASKMSYRSIDDYVELFADDELAFQPGSNWSYSNAGFYVLGQIVEAASGLSYYEYLRQHIYQPAGMTNSDSFDMDIPVKNLAIGYTTGRMGLDRDDDGTRWLGEGGWRNNIFMHSIKGGPAGGGFSTSPELIAFARALRNGTITSASMFDTLASVKPQIGSPEYGYGFGVEESPGVGRVVGHSGGFPGINARLDIYLDNGYDVAVMANMDGAAGRLAQRIQDLMAGMP